jgi:MFS family permease
VGSQSITHPKALVDSDVSISNTRYTYLAAIGMLSILSFCIGLNGTWAYMERIGDAAGINSLTIAGTLSTASIFGIVGAVVATILGNKIGRLPVILFGIGLLILGLFLMQGTPSVLSYTIAAFIFKYSWTFTFPYLLAVMAGIDRTGKLLIVSNIVIGGGMALGPAISAQLIGDSGLHYGRIIVMAMAVMVVSAILIMPLVGQARKQDVTRAKR